MGPIRQSLSNQRTGRTTGTRRIRGRIQGKANAIQKEIGNYRIITQNSLSLLRLYHRIALRYFDRRARVRPGAVFHFLFGRFKIFPGNVYGGVAHPQYK